jgi:hypothetical protein
VVLGQVDAEAKTNEIPVSATVLDRIDLAGAASRRTRYMPRAPTPSTWSPSEAHTI